MKEHITKLNFDDYKTGDYPDCLDEAVSILVCQKENFIPAGYNSMAINDVESQVMQAEKDGNPVEVKRLQKEFHESIENHKTDISSMIWGLYEYGHKGYVTAFLHSQDNFNEDNFPISIPEMPRFQFEIKPSEFDLGLTGRILTDGNQDFKERLKINCGIYQAFEFASQMSPKSIFAKMKDGTLKMLKSDYKIIGNVSSFDEKGVVHIELSEEDNKDTIYKTEPLKSGLDVKFSEEWLKVFKSYNKRAMIFGHEEKKLSEFLRKNSNNGHLFWKIAYI